MVSASIDRGMTILRTNMKMSLIKEKTKKKTNMLKLYKRAFNRNRWERSLYDKVMLSKASTKARRDIASLVNRAHNTRVNKSNNHWKVKEDTLNQAMSARARRAPNQVKRVAWNKFRVKILNQALRAVLNKLRHNSRNSQLNYPNLNIATILISSLYHQSTIQFILQRRTCSTLPMRAQGMPLVLQVPFRITA